MDKDLFDQIAAFLLPEMSDANARKSLVEGALHGSSVLQKIDWNGAAQTFTVQLMEQLLRFSEVAPGKPALAVLLEELKPLVGADRRAEADWLLAQIEAIHARRLPKAQGLPESLQALFDAVCDAAGEIALSDHQARAIKSHDPVDLTEYRLGRIAEWSLPQYYLDKRFVNLTMIVDKGEHETQRWQGIPAEEFRFNDLRDVLEKRNDDRAMVVLGAPGSGKSTLLRRLQLDHSMDCLRDGEEQVSFFVPLNSYREDKNGGRPEPREWLDQQWAKHYPSFSAVAPFFSNTLLSQIVVRDGRETAGGIAGEYALILYSYSGSDSAYSGSENYRCEFGITLSKK